MQGERIEMKRRGRPVVIRRCDTCGVEMSARDLHDHKCKREADDARWEAIFQRFVDPHYYDRDERSPVPCTLTLMARVNSRSSAVCA